MSSKSRPTPKKTRRSNRTSGSMRAVQKAKASKKAASTREMSEASTKAMVADPVKRYLAEIRRYPILTKEEEYELAVQFIGNRDPEIALQLITSNLRLVVKIALEYQSTWTSLLDLIQEGNVGLIQAVEKFDPSKNIRLSSYAQWWIRAYILKYLMDNYKLVKIGTTQAQRKLFYNLKKEKDRLERQGFKPTPKMLAKALNVRERDVTEMEARLAGRETSLDAPLVDGERGTLVDLIPSKGPEVDDIIAKRELSRSILHKLKEFEQTLGGRDIEIWRRRLMVDSPMTLQQIGDMFGVSRERARQLEARILRNLKKFLGDEVEEIQNLEFPLFVGDEHKNNIAGK
ncbi:MAG: RNA polymerase factor sigma-32 [Myxococcota bacterium]